MSSSREESPDWLRTFQAPTYSALKSDSDSSPRDSPLREERIDHKEPSLHKSSPSLDRDKSPNKVLSKDARKSSSKKSSKKISPKKQLKADRTSSEKKKVDSSVKTEGNGDDGKVGEAETSKKHMGPQQALNHSVWTLSSDSESCPHDSPIREEKISQFEASEKHEDAVLIGKSGESSLKKASKENSPRKQLKVESQKPKQEKTVTINLKRKGNDGDLEVSKEETSDKHIEHHVSTSSLPLVLSEKVHRSKALVECEGESIDLSGDMGAVGRMVVPYTPSGNHEMYLDLKGTIYKTTVVPSRTFCVVSFGQSDAKIEAIMNDFIQLKPQPNVYEAETMVEGTLDGFSFESEDESDKIPKATSHQIDQSEGTGEQTNGKTKDKAEKTTGLARKRGRTTGIKPQPAKKVRKKSLVSKKTKTKK